MSPQRYVPTGSMTAEERLLDLEHQREKMAQTLDVAADRLGLLVRLVLAMGVLLAIVAAEVFDIMYIDVDLRPGEDLEGFHLSDMWNHLTEAGAALTVLAGAVVAWRGLRRASS